MICAVFSRKRRGFPYLLCFAAIGLVSGVGSYALGDSLTGDPLAAVVINGTSVVPENTPFTVPPGSVTHIFFYDGFAIAAVTTPNANPPAGAKNQPDPTKPRIQLPPPPPPFPPPIIPPPGHIIQIPQPENVRSISQVLFQVVVIYNDGSTATVPGTYLSPGTPNPPGNFLSTTITPGTGLSGLPPSAALTLFTQFVNDPDLTAELGYPLTLSDFAYNFSGTTDFPIWTGPTTFEYPDGTTEEAAFSAVPEPTTFAGAALCLIVLGARIRQKRGKR